MKFAIHFILLSKYYRSVSTSLTAGKECVSMTRFRKLFGSRPEYNISWRSVDKPRKLKPLEPTFIIEICYRYKRLLYQYIPPFLISDRESM